MKRNTLAGVVVLYHPKPSVWENIQSYLGSLDKLYIVNNSTEQSSLLQHLLASEQTQLLYSGENIGIAKALNLALKQAEEDNIEWLMTFDQDSAFERDDFSLFLNACEEVVHERVAIFSPLHQRRLQKPASSSPFSTQLYVMTSANRVNVAIAQEVGGYDENLFIDEVDHEFCFRLHMHHYRVFVHHTIAIKHTLGEKYRHRGREITLYDAKRLYYMSRNYLYIREKYYRYDKTFFKQRDRYLLRFFKNQLLYGKSRFQNLKSILYGYRDYRNRAFGKGHHV